MQRDPSSKLPTGNALEDVPESGCPDGCPSRPDEHAPEGDNATAKPDTKPTGEHFAEAVAKLTDGRGVDVVYDSVGQATFDGSLRCLRQRGLLCLFGQSSGPVPPFDLGRLSAMGSVFVTRPSLLHYTATREELELRAGEVLGAVADGSLSVRIGERFSLSAAADAHRALEGRLTSGKVLLLPD